MGWVTRGIPLDQTSHPALETPALVVVIVVRVVLVGVSRVVVNIFLKLSPITCKVSLARVLSPRDHQTYSSTN